MTGRSQEELVAMLRSTKQGENVCVVVARQEDIFLPRELVRGSVNAQKQTQHRCPHTVSVTSAAFIHCLSSVVVFFAFALLFLSVPPLHPSLFFFFFNISFPLSVFPFSLSKDQTSFCADALFFCP